MAVTLWRLMHMVLNLTPLFCLRRYDADQEEIDAANARTAAIYTANRATRARIARRHPDA